MNSLLLPPLDAPPTSFPTPFSFLSAPAISAVALSRRIQAQIQLMSAALHDSADPETMKHCLQLQTVILSQIYRLFHDVMLDTNTANPSVAAYLNRPRAQMLVDIIPAFSEIYLALKRGEVTDLRKCIGSQSKVLMIRLLPQIYRELGYTSPLLSRLSRAGGGQVQTSSSLSRLPSSDPIYSYASPSGSSTSSGGAEPAVTPPASSSSGVSPVSQGASPKRMDHPDVRYDDDSIKKSRRD